MGSTNYLYALKRVTFFITMHNIMCDVSTTTNTKVNLQQERNKPTHKKSVSFDQIHVREYIIDLGDNPSCSKGPPLSITWEYEDMGTIDLAEFEEMRPSRRQKIN